METAEISNKEKEKKEIEDTKEKYAFIISFTAVCWQKIWLTSLIYCQQKKISITNSVILKSLKYELLSTKGVFFEIEPFLRKALLQGFLMPKEYNGNEYVKKAIQLFGESYKISKIIDKEEKRIAEIKFMNNYVYTLFKNKKEYKTDENFCELIESWDIELGLYEFQSVFQELIVCSLFQILNEN